jgi:hypothetical protein
LTVSEFDGKYVPYDTTETNYGFRNLRAGPYKLEDVPELVRDPSLKDLVLRLNDPNRGVMTIGSASYDLEEISSGGGHFIGAYVEVVVDGRRAMSGKALFVTAFECFKDLLHAQDPALPVAVRWDMRPVCFEELGIEGYSCAVHVRTRYCSSPAVAQYTWERVARLIPLAFNGVDRQPDPLFGAQESGTGAR